MIRNNNEYFYEYLFVISFFPLNLHFASNFVLISLSNLERIHTFIDLAKFLKFSSYISPWKIYQYNPFKIKIFWDKGKISSLPSVIYDENIFFPSIFL